jgi:chemotaxis protein MotB
MKVTRPKKSTLQFRKFSDEREAWLLSYADIITMLLCFFVLFFSTDKKRSSGEFSEMMAFIQAELGLRVNEKTENLKKLKTLMKDRYGDESLLAELKDLNKKDSLEILNYKHFVAIEFPKGNLFDQGMDNLSAKSLEEIRPIVEGLKKYKEKMNINIVAYTDPTAVNPVSRSKRWWTNNRELSAQRALNVQKIFLANGFTESQVFITGRGIKDISVAEDRPTSLDGKIINTKSYNSSRTITIRLEPKDIQ